MDENDKSFLEKRTIINDWFKLSWKDLKYEVPITEVEWERLRLPFGTWTKEILKSVNGFVRNFETCFIMGASGAGKTSMLNTLCNRIPQNQYNSITGSISINDDIPITAKEFGNYGAYVMQDDILFETFSCKECLLFAARLRLNKREDII